MGRLRRRRGEDVRVAVEIVAAATDSDVELRQMTTMQRTRRRRQEADDAGLNQKRLYCRPDIRSLLFS
ncbi:unnamed protein product [Linum trigynum]|uniref:Uncharacterized protein n=1 Tax=Linum trigynum TaxID=586398 RepID=A0AAV2FD64_9ROSI